MTEQELIEFCNYVQPIVSGCSGFIRTNGYMAHLPGVIVLMSDDETFCTIIKTPMIYNIILSASIGTFIGLKEDEQKAKVFENTYYIGYNIKFNHLMNYLNLYDEIDQKVKCIYSEDDCYRIPGFEEVSQKSDISIVNVSDGIRNYRVPASKAVTPITKSDTVNLRLYDYIANPLDNGIKTIRYTIYKKKFKLSVDIFANILVV